MTAILKQNKILSGSAIIIGSAIFLPFYILAIASTFAPLAPMPNRVSDILSTLLFIPFYIVSTTFFSNATIYVIASIISLALGIAALIWGNSGRLARTGALATILLIVAFPVAYRYTPSLSAAPGYKMLVVTQPGFPGSIVKMSQVITEKQPCEYKLLGWNKSNQLYYQATCNTQTQFWQYSVAPIVRSEQVSSVPTDLSQATISQHAVLGMVRADGVRPENYEATTLPLYMQSEGYVSLDGQWTAIVTRHIYGPEDVVIITLK